MWVRLTDELVPTALPVAQLSGGGERVVVLGGEALVGASIGQREGRVLRSAGSACRRHLWLPLMATASRVSLHDPQTLYRHWEEQQWNPFAIYSLIIGAIASPTSPKRATGGSPPSMIEM
jgi:hypothetical protein